MGKREDRRYGGRLAVLTFVLLCLQGTGGQAYAQEDKAGERRIRYSSSYLRRKNIWKRGKLPTGLWGQR